MKNSSDKTVFMRTGDIKSHLSIDIKHLRDINNVLGFLSKEENEEVLFAINEDTLGQICKFHNISKRDAVMKMQNVAGPVGKGQVKKGDMSVPSANRPTVALD